MIKKNLPIYYFLISFFAVILFIFICLYLVPNTMIPLLAGLTLAYAFDPLIDYFENKGFCRKKVVFWFFLLLVSLFVLTITIILPYLFIQLSEFIENFPSFLIKSLNYISEKLNIETSSIKNKFTDFISTQYNAKAFSQLANMLRTIFASTANWLGTFLSVFLIPVFFYFFLIDIDRLTGNLFKLVPRNYRSYAIVRVKKIDQILSGFIRGQLTVAFILCFLYSLGFLIIGVKYGVLIGFIAGILSIVPYLGATFGILASIFMSFFADNTLYQLISILILFGIVQFFEGFFITPKIVGNKVGLSPLTIILGVLIGGELFGIAGMLVAIPLFGILKVIYRDCKTAYYKSNFYKKA